MKKLLTLLAVAAAVFAFTPTESQAGESYRSRIHARCGHCGNNVLAYYQPVRSVLTRQIFGWVPNYHSNCGVSLHGSVYGLRQVAGESNLRYSYGTPNQHNYGYGAGYTRRTTPVTGLKRNYLSSRTVPVYPGWRYNSLNRCR